MVKVTVLYGHPKDPAAFEEYYAKTHLPLVDKVPNFQKYETARLVGMLDGTELLEGQAPPNASRTSRQVG